MRWSLFISLYEFGSGGTASPLSILNRTMWRWHIYLLRAFYAIGCA